MKKACGNVTRFALADAQIIDTALKMAENLNKGWCGRLLCFEGEPHKKAKEFFKAGGYRHA
jgi:hypothetical protein